MIWAWIWTGGYVAFLLPCARFALDSVVVPYDIDDPETEEYAMAASVALILALIWPLFIPGYYVYWMLKRSKEHQ